MSTDLASTSNGGYLTQPQSRGLPPALMAEQQRAKSEIEASLTIAAARPRDQKRARDNILIQCQRPGLAAKAQFRYARGGTDISGATIDLMEVIAQCWGNLVFGFRELQRFPGAGNQPGESVVEAFAWDLETNTRRCTQFTVSHSERTKKGLKVFTDPRDIYEWVANQAQRRVRTTLENIIPRDIIESAVEECERTLLADIKDVADATAKMLSAFSEIGVTTEMIEGHIQRRIDTITPAQIIGLRKIYTSIKNEMSEPGTWFSIPEKTEEKPQTAVEKAKEAMKSKKQETQKTATPKPETSQDPPTKPKPEKPVTPPVESKPIPESPVVSQDQAVRYEEDAQQWLVDLDSVSTIKGLNDAKAAIPAVWPEQCKNMVAFAIDKKIEIIRGARGERSNPPKPPEEGLSEEGLFEQPQQEYYDSGM